MSIDLVWGEGEADRFRDCELIVFDKDGTLIDFEALWVNLAAARAQRIADQLSTSSPELFAWRNRLLHALGIDIETGKIALPSPIFDLSFDHQAFCLASLIRAFLPDKFSYPEALRLARDAQSWVASEIRPDDLIKVLPGVMEFFGKLPNQEVKLALVTSDRYEGAEKALDKLGLLDRFAVIRGSDRSPSKPNGLALRQVCEELGIKPARTVMIGDSTNDIRMASEAQVFSLGLETMLDRSSLRAAGASATFQNWDQLSVQLPVVVEPVAHGKTLLMRSDGASRGNPGPAACAYVIYSYPELKILQSHGRTLGIVTNNQAEYQGVIEGLKAALKLKPRELLIEIDSELIVKQLWGTYRVRDPEMQRRHDEVISLAKNINWKIKHIPRAQNKEADRLCNQALDAET